MLRNQPASRYAPFFHPRFHAVESVNMLKTGVHNRMLDSALSQNYNLLILAAQLCAIIILNLFISHSCSIFFHFFILKFSYVIIHVVLFC